MQEITDIQKKLVHSTPNSSDHIRLYFYKKRISKGESYFECANANVDKINESYSEVISATCNFLEDKEIFDYMPDMPKSAVGFFDLTDTNNILLDTLSDLSDQIVSASDFDTAIKYDGYIIEFLKDEKFIRLLFSSKAIRVYTKRYAIVDNFFKQENKPMFEIKKMPDCIWTNEYCLFLTSAAETIFDFIKHYKHMAQKALIQIEKAELLSIDNMKFFREYALQGRHPQKFETFKSDKLQAFIELSNEEKIEVLNGILLKMENEKISISSEEDAKNLLDFVCGKILDDFTGEKYLVSNTQKFNKPNIQR